MRKDQQAEMEQLSFLRSTQGVPREPIGAVFEQLYASSLLSTKYLLASSESASRGAGLA